MWKKGVKMVVTAVAGFSLGAAVATAGMFWWAATTMMEVIENND